MHRSEAETRIHAPAIDMDCARTALAMIASLFGSGQVQVFAKAIQKSGAWIDPEIVLLAVHTKRYRNDVLRLGG